MRIKKIIVVSLLTLTTVFSAQSQSKSFIYNGIEISLDVSEKNEVPKDKFLFYTKSQSEDTEFYIFQFDTLYFAKFYHYRKNGQLREKGIMRIEDCCGIDNCCFGGFHKYGYWYEYDKKGKLTTSGNFEGNDNKTGTWTKYDETGGVIE